MLRGIQPGILCLFLLPVLLALVSRSSERLSTRVVATGFLTLIDCGHLLAPHPWLFPNLPQIDQNLGQADNRILGWYALMYLLYGFVIFPPFLFGRGILDRRTGRAEFTLFTNVLGLVGWFVTAPGFIWISVDQLGLWPIVRW